MIRVRSIARILRGEELTISYVDPAKPYSDLRAKLSAKYLFDCGDADLRWTAGDDDPRRTAAIAAAYGVQGPTSEPAAVVGKVTDAVDSAIERGAWPVVLEASEALLYLYRFTYPAVHPQVGIRLLTAGLSALKLQPPDGRRAVAMLTQAAEQLGITHGRRHPVASSAAQALAVAAGLHPGVLLAGPASPDVAPAGDASAAPTSAPRAQVARETAVAADDAIGEPRLPQGTVVEVHGLRSRPALNGEVGRVVLFSESKGRYAVQLAAAVAAQPLLLKAENLTPQV